MIGFRRTRALFVLYLAICRQEGEQTEVDFYWDWPDQAKVIRRTDKHYSDPPHPVISVGDAPWNPGREVWNGVLRGFQFYDVALTPDDIANEIGSAGSVQTPWYLNHDPTPSDIADKSGGAHHPVWVGTERPAVWHGSTAGNAIIRTTVLPP